MNPDTSKKVRKDDEGELQIAVYVKDKHLIMDFGKKTAWIGLHKEEVEGLCKILLEKLKEL